MVFICVKMNVERVVTYMINIQADSRKVKKGDIFVALRGISSDGHDYIPKAIENGASLVVCEEDRGFPNTKVVADSRKYLEEYLKENYSKYLKEMTIVGISGTNGKTTSAKLLHDALNLSGVKCAYIGTIGFYINEKIKNLPNTTVDICDTYDLLVEAYEKGCKVVVLEASSQGLDMGRLDTIDFDYALFTNLTEDHLDYHKTMENYALAKQILYKRSNVNVVNIDDPYKDYFILDNKETYTYGKNKSDFQITNIDIKQSKTVFTYKYKGTETTIESNLIGEYNVYNLMGVICLLSLMGIKDIPSIVSKLHAPVGRMENIDYKGNTIIIDYAHTEDAIDKLINTMKPYIKGKTYVVFGCTGSREREKRSVMTSLVSKLSDFFIITMDDLHDESFDQIVGDMLENATFDNYEVIENRRDAIEKGISLLNNEDYLFILGKGHEEAIIIGKEKIPFNDKETVKEIISKN